MGQADKQFQKELKYRQVQEHKHKVTRAREKKIRNENANREQRVALELDFIKKLKR